MVHDGHGQAGIRLRGDADMDAAIAVHDFRLVVIVRVNRGMAGDGLDQRHHQQWQRRQARPVVGGVAGV